VKTQQPKQSIGVIQSLSSGFDLVTRRPELMLLPVLLDTFFWLGPRLSAYPLFRATIDLLNSPGAASFIGLTTPEQVGAFRDFLDQAGQSLNLFWWLSPTLLGVPSLMIGVPSQRVPNGQSTIWPLSNELAYFALFFLLSLIGLGLSATYWEMLSSRVRDQALSLGHIAALWWGLIKIAILITIVGLMIGIPTAVVAALLGMLNPLIGLFAVVMGGTMVLWVLFYLAFTVHGVALRRATVFQAVRVSVLLMRFQFPSTVGLILVALAVYIGLGFVWNIPPNDSWLRAAGILGHAFVATGLLTATALYYMDRTQPAESQQPAAGLQP
jgi:hypothetical protein